MTLLGLDFDNTLVEYDLLFFETALEHNLIPSSLPKNKTSVRDYLRSIGNEDRFTLLQGEVYGKKIADAKPAQGLIEALQNIKELGIPMVLISHKTKNPIKGPPYDLHLAARDWLEKHGFFDPNVLGWKYEDVYFEETKFNKINRILSCNCTNYVDDLPEILAMIPDTVVKHLYDPCNIKTHTNCYPISSWSELVEQVSSH